MMAEKPVRRDSEHEKLVAEIHKAFAEVSREGGVSWSESVVVDDNGSDERRAAARMLDKEASWQDLVKDPEWDSSTGVGGWSFLDAVGFRYYLPAGMLRHLAGDGVDGFPYQLTLPRYFLRDHTLKTWSLLDGRQCACVAWFTRCMARTYEEAGNEHSAKQWWRAYRSHWEQFSK
jgi:hypothetical protein